MNLLALVATVLVGHFTPVHCAAPPSYPWRGSVVGYASWPPDEIWLRDCAATQHERRWAVDIFAHEILHIKHKHWLHPRVYAEQHRYGALVLQEIRIFKH